MEFVDFEVIHRIDHSSVLHNVEKKRQIHSNIFIFEYLRSLESKYQVLIDLFFMKERKLISNA